MSQIVGQAKPQAAATTSESAHVMASPQALDSATPMDIDSQKAWPETWKCYNCQKIGHLTNNYPEPCKQHAQNDFLEKDILDIIAKAIATTLNDQEKQRDTKADAKADFDSVGSAAVNDTLLNQSFLVLENCMVGSTKDMLDLNTPPATEEVVSKSKMPELADTQSKREKWILEALRNKIFWRSTYIPIQVHMVDSNCLQAMKALIECGMTGEFIDHKFVQAHKLRTYQLPRLIRLYNADGSPNKIGKITEAIDLVV